MVIGIWLSDKWHLCCYFLLKASWWTRYICTDIYVYLCVSGCMDACTHIHTHVHVHTCVRICLYVYKHSCRYICVYAHLRGYTCICVHMCVYVHCTNVYMHICMYVYVCAESVFTEPESGHIFKLLEFYKPKKGGQKTFVLGSRETM